MAKTSKDKIKRYIYISLSGYATHKKETFDEWHEALMITKNDKKISKELKEVQAKYQEV